MREDRFASEIAATVRELPVGPDLNPNPNLRSILANRAFCGSLHVSKEETEGRRAFKLGCGQ